MKNLLENLMVQTFLGYLNMDAKDIIFVQGTEDFSGLMSVGYFKLP